MADESYIDVYPVGVLRDLRRARYEWSILKRRRSAVRTFWRWFARSWQRRTYWNGYLAEWHYPPQIRHTRCGHGWTRRRALRSLGDHIVEMNRKPSNSEEADLG